MKPHDRFPWGHIVNKYEFGPYYIAAYHPDKPGLPEPGYQPPTYYHIWVDGVDTHTSTYTLEGALLVAIATKLLGRHPPSLELLARALKLPEEY